MEKGDDGSVQVFLDHIEAEKNKKLSGRKNCGWIMALPIPVSVW